MEEGQGKEIDEGDSMRNAGRIKKGEEESEVKGKVLKTFNVFLRNSYRRNLN